MGIGGDKIHQAFPEEAVEKPAAPAKPQFTPEQLAKIEAAKKAKAAAEAAKKEA